VAITQIDVEASEGAHLDITTTLVEGCGAGRPTNPQPGRLRYVAQASLACEFRQRLAAGSGGGIKMHTLRSWPDVCACLASLER